MNDLERLDAAIVEAAERLADGAWSHERINTVINAVQAKREAQRPPCQYQLFLDGGWGDICGNPAVQIINYVPGSIFNDISFCVDHKVTVTEL